MHDFGKHNYKDLEKATQVIPSAGAPEPFGTQAVAEARVDLPGSRTFQYMYHPRRWAWMDDQWLPVLGKLVLEPGVNGVTGRCDPRPAIQRAIERGWRMIPLDCIPRGYVHRYINKTGKAVHMSIFEQVEIVAGKTMVKTDQPGYRAFLNDLIDRGLIEPLNEEVRRELIERKRLSLDYQRQMMGRTHLQELYERDKNTFAAMEASDGTGSNDGKTARKTRKATT
jgi:hypothetical protein